MRKIRRQEVSRKARRSIAKALILSMLLGCFSTPAFASTNVRDIAQSGQNYINLSGKTEYEGIKLATGARITKDQLLKESRKVDIRAFGAVALEDRKSGDTDTYAVENTEAINAAIKSLGKAGGTVVIPAGTYRCYTIELENNINLYLEKGAVLQAARTTMYDKDGNVTSEAEDFYEDGEPGNYKAPTPNKAAGLQDNGHTYFENSLIYAADKKNIMIYGDGLIDGSQLNDEGLIENVLMGNDPADPSDREGTVDKYFGNKAIALLRTQNVVLSGVNILNGGHFAIIADACDNVMVEDMIVDTNRDAFDIDSCSEVTIQNSHFNSLTDDAIVFKAPFGSGLMKPVENCLVRNCVVSGYDAGSVLAGTYTTDKLVATDQCGPTARIKFGTESTAGYNTVTIDGVRFERSRGFAMEAVDGSPIHDIVMVNAEMENISSSPIFIRIGNRGRYPVTGQNDDTTLNKGESSVRLSNSKWVLPLKEGYDLYPIQRYFPSYRYASEKIEMPNGKEVQIIDQNDPVKLNDNNYETGADGKLHPYIWSEAEKKYVLDESKVLNVPEEGETGEVDERGYYGDAVGYSDLASADNIFIGNVKIDNVDPRYPVTLAGLVDSKITNVKLKDIDITYRGGIRMEDAVEQQLIETKWEYAQHNMATSSQVLPWLSNTFFSKNASLTPRVVWDEENQTWKDEPYNVPEMPEQYPEPSNFGILPAYGIYARHVDGLELENVSVGYEIDDERHAVVLDDCQNVDFKNFKGETENGVKKVALINNNYKRPTSFEYVPNEPYIQTKTEHVTGLSQNDIYEHTVNAPEPTTPQDDLYKLPTTASADDYSYSDAEWTYNGQSFDLPVTVYRPYFVHIPDQEAKEFQELSFRVEARNPAAERDGVRDQNASDESLTYSAKNLPAGATFDEATGEFYWELPKKGTYNVTFTADDGVIPVKTTVKIVVTGNTATESTPSEATPSNAPLKKAVSYVKDAAADKSIAQKYYEDEESASSYLDEMVQKLLADYKEETGYEVTATASDASAYEAPVAGTKSDKDGQNGSIEKTYHFTWAYSFDGGSGAYETDAKVGLVITATPYAGNTSGGSSSGSSGGSGTVLGAAYGTSAGAAAAGQWELSGSDWRYRKADGTYAANTWLELSWNNQSSWYHFDADGKMSEGWFTDTDGRTYFLHNVSDNTKGRMYTGWNWIEGKCYYFETVKGSYVGHLYRNTTTPDGYAVDEEGAWTVNGAVQTK